MHVVKPERVRLERSNQRRLFAIPLAAAAVAIGVALAGIVTPGIAGHGASPRGVLPFGLCQKAILLAGQPREPAYILLGVAPAHVDHRHLPSSPAVWHSRARSRGDASIPLFECHLELGNGEWLCDRHLMRRAFTGFPVRLVLRRAHSEFASRDDDHSGAAVRTFLEIRARPHDFLCDGARIDEAQARKTEQDHETGDQHPAAHPLRWLLRVRRERPRDHRAAKRAEKFAPPNLFNSRHLDGETIALWKGRRWLPGNMLSG